MKTALAIGIMFSFIGIAVLGFTAMNHENSHGYGCIATTAQGINCSNESGIMNLVSFHSGVFKGFSTALLGQSTAILLFTLFLLATGIGIASTSSCALMPSPPHAHEKLLCLSFFSPSKTELIHWLALHENSPSTL